MITDKSTMDSCFILIYKHKDSGDMVALVEKDEEELVLSAERTARMGHTILYTLCVFADAVTRYH